MAARLVEVYRGGIIESVHMGSVVVMHSDGHILYKLGNAERLTYFRSAAKPLIAINSLEAGIAEEYGLDLKEVAILAASHTGEQKHVDTLNGIMRKIQVKEEQLKCGIHAPLFQDAAQKLFAAGKVPTSIHCNCSGKHLGIMAAIKSKGMGMEDYYKTDHPVYEGIEQVLSEFCRLPHTSIVKGIDGCGIPVYGVPLRNMAIAYANLANTGFLNGKYKKSQELLIKAITTYPEMLGGTDRADTHIIRHFGDRLICKIGAEALHCTGLLGRDTGIAFKIEDGNIRAVGPVIIEILLQIGVISREEAEKLKEFWNPPLLNHRKEVVGEIKAVFKLFPP
ncbi:MAG: asparaginase [Acetivibrionales bacterium]